jgi:hypothetical protein
VLFSSSVDVATALTVLHGTINDVSVPAATTGGLFYVNNATVVILSGPQIFFKW